SARGRDGLPRLTANRRGTPRARRDRRAGGRSTGLNDARGFVLPVAVAKQALVELAGRQTRQLVVEVDAARALEVRQVLTAELDQLALGLPARFVAGLELNDRLHFLAEVLVGNTDDRDVRHLRVRDEKVLGLLRVDVHAAGDDH